VTVPPPKQLPGCLPKGFDRNSFLAPAQFCRWRGISLRTFASRRASLPGVASDSARDVKIHVGTYLDGTFAKGGRR